MIDEWRDNLDLETNLLLESLKKEESEICENIMVLYLNGLKISEMCKILKISRFKVKRQLNKGLYFFRNIINKEQFRRN